MDGQLGMKWYYLSAWATTIKEAEVDRETDEFVFIRGYRFKKSTDNEWYSPSKQELKDKLVARCERNVRITEKALAAYKDELAQAQAISVD